MEVKYQRLVEALKKADQAAKDADPGEDGGTCNFDSPVLHLPHVRSATRNAIAEAAGVALRPVHSWGAGYYHVGVTLHGQAGRRTAMVEAAAKSLYESLEKDGLPWSATIYYQMD